MPFMTSRQRLVVATTELLRANGFHGTSIADITGAAGLPSGSLYHHFPAGKTELAEVAVRESGAIYLQLFEAIWEASAAADTAITDFFDGAADTLEQLDYVDICPVGSVAREVASTHDGLRAAADEAMQSWIDALARRLADAGVPPGDVALLAPTIVAAIEGGFTLARAARDTAALRRAGLVMRRLVADAVASSPDAAAVS